MPDQPADPCWERDGNDLSSAPGASRPSSPPLPRQLIPLGRAARRRRAAVAPRASGAPGRMSCAAQSLGGPGTGADAHPRRRYRRGIGQAGRDGPPDPRPSVSPARLRDNGFVPVWPRPASALLVAHDGRDLRRCSRGKRHRPGQDRGRPAARRMENHAGRRKGNHAPGGWVPHAKARAPDRRHPRPRPRDKIPNRSGPWASPPDTCNETPSGQAGAVQDGIRGSAERQSAPQSRHKPSLAIGGDRESDQGACRNGDDPDRRNRIDRRHQEKSRELGKIR